MNSLGGAKCVGLHWLFDSVLLADHEEAKKKCAECPAILQCKQILKECASSQRGGGPQGTWAGELIGASQGGQHRPREHGTDRGYYQHTYLRDIACTDCLAAHAAVVRARTKKVAS